MSTSINAHGIRRIVIGPIIKNDLGRGKEYADKDPYKHCKIALYGDDNNNVKITVFSSYGADRDLKIEFEEPDR